MPDITFFHKTHLDDHFPTISRKSTKFDEPKAFFLTRTIKTNARTCRHNNGVNFDHLSSFLFQSQKGTRDFEGRLWDEFSLWLFPTWKPLKWRRKEKRLKFFLSCLFRVFESFRPLVLDIFFVKTSSPLLIVIPRLKREDRERERDASVCCCSYQ